MDKVKNILTSWLDAFIANLPEIGLAISVLLVFILIAKVISRVVTRLTNRFSKNLAVNKLVGTLTGITTVLLGGIVSLNILGLNTAIASVLAGAGIAGIAIGFAFQDLAANIIAGITVAIQKPFNVGDLVKVDNFFGVIRKINLRMTELETMEGEIVYIPNKAVVGAPIMDYIETGKHRVELQTAVSYTEDLEKVKTVTLDAINKVPNVIKDESLDVFFDGFDEYYISVKVRFWIPFKSQADRLEAQSQAIMNIKKAFDENDIVIPFPVRTVELNK
ncbi:MAG: mechanosensitive ion channel [Candidatus Spechtbacterales bacterium]|nr:mechanosensitive ion channel [Candidatus Spechtbacterales bacterium]